jgi:hypothetical protein
MLPGGVRMLPLCFRFPRHTSGEAEDSVPGEARERAPHPPLNPTVSMSPPLSVATRLSVQHSVLSETSHTTGGTPYSM